MVATSGHPLVAGRRHLHQVEALLLEAILEAVLAEKLEGLQVGRHSASVLAQTWIVPEQEKTTH
jgi:hypothetical protein